MQEFVCYIQLDWLTISRSNFLSIYWPIGKPCKSNGLLMPI